MPLAGAGRSPQKIPRKSKPMVCALTRFAVNAGFIRLSRRKRESTAQYIVGLAFCLGHIPRRSARKPAGRQAKPVCQARPAASPLPQKSPVDIFGDTPVK